jgi:hypothetical protein
MFATGERATLGHMRIHPGLAAGAAFYLGVGAAALARPALVPAIFGGAAPTPAARTEVRAVYGGLPLAMAAIVVRERHRPARPMTTAVAVLSGAMAAGRLAGVVAERESDAVTRAFVVLEVATAVALAVGARSAGE